MPHMLLVEDEERFAQPITDLAHRFGYSSSCARTLREARRLLHHEARDLMLLDLSLPDGCGIELLNDPGEMDLDRVILLSDTDDAGSESALNHMRPKVRDCLTKPLDMNRIQHHLQHLHNDPPDNANGNGRNDDKPKDGQNHGSSNGQHTDDELNHYGPLVGRSAPMVQLYHMIARTALTDATALIVGESGTGKELVARLLHERSHRRKHPYLPLNCGAIPENLIEAELFGHEKGAFTGANHTRRGVFERAHQGTLLLDEITEMPADMQVRLLRVLETGEVTRIGSERTINVDVRIIAATNRPIHDALKAGKLREDLLYRLAVVPLHVAPLRERPEDIDLLADHFLEALNQRYGLTKRLTADARRQLARHPWPGNVRQLRNMLERAFIISDRAITAEALAQPLLPGASTLAPTGEPGVHVAVGSSLADAERQLIAATLRHHRGDKRRAARVLGISLKTLYNRLNAYKAKGCEV